MNSYAALQIQDLGIADYQTVWQQMQNFTDSRSETTPDQLWLVQHPPVFTLGQRGERSHILQTTDIPVIQTDRGGQITYHGPGQLVVYPLIDLRRRNMGVRALVTLIETVLIQLLNIHDIEAHARADAPGVYVDKNKIASLGLRVRKGCSFHGLALNVDMDLSPFSYINPCGMAGLKMTQMKDFVPGIDPNAVKQDLVRLFMEKLSCCP